MRSLVVTEFERRSTPQKPWTFWIPWVTAAHGAMDPSSESTFHRRFLRETFGLPYRPALSVRYWRVSPGISSTGWTCTLSNNPWIQHWNSQLGCVCPPFEVGQFPPTIEQTHVTDISYVGDYFALTYLRHQASTQEHITIVWCNTSALHVRVDWDCLHIISTESIGTPQDGTSIPTVFPYDWGFCEESHLLSPPKCSNICGFIMFHPLHPNMVSGACFTWTGQGNRWAVRRHQKTTSQHPHSRCCGGMVAQKRRRIAGALVGQFSLKIGWCLVYKERCCWWLMNGNWMFYSSWWNLSNGKANSKH